MIIRSEEIYKKANSIVKSCGTRDTLKIARELGIHLHFLDNLNDLLGIYTYEDIERIKHHEQEACSAFFCVRRDREGS